MISRVEAGRRLRSAREAAGLGQGEAADRAGLSRPYLSDLERGERVCGWPRLVALVTVLGLDPRQVVPEFFDGRGSAGP
jgi:transcriptional regulator with XRE-family HTH domain